MKPETAPAELLCSTPRAVRLTAAGKAAATVAIALAAGALFAGVWLHAAAERAATRRILIRNEAAAGQAEVARLGRTGGKNSRRVVIYRYSAGGRIYEGRARLRQRDRRNIETEARIAIHYLPSDPATSWMPGYEPQGVPMWTVVVVPLCLALGAAPIVLVLRKQKALLSNGRPAQARVTGSRRVPHGTHGGHAYRVEYEFSILSGARRTGSFEKAKEPPAAGSVLTIIYDPENPPANGRYPLSLYRVE
ncbi:MAG: DUF3592 domain-containing protein [Acidobacteriota bacterium]